MQQNTTFTLTYPQNKQGNQQIVQIYKHLFLQGLPSHLNAFLDLKTRTVLSDPPDTIYFGFDQSQS